MIILPAVDKEFLLDLNEKYGISTVLVDENSWPFSQELMDKVDSDGEEMEAYYNHLHLMELGAELQYKAKLDGPFRIIITDGIVTTESI